MKNIDKKISVTLDNESRCKKYMEIIKENLNDLGVKNFRMSHEFDDTKYGFGYCNVKIIS